MTSPGELMHERTADPPSAPSPTAHHAANERPGTRPPLVLIFFTSPTSGPCRRMHGLVAWIKVTRKAALSVVEADLERHAPLARRLGVSEAPTLVLLRDGAPVARRVGRATGREIDQLLRPWLSAVAAETSTRAGDGPASRQAAAEPADDAAPERAG